MQPHLFVVEDNETIQRVIARTAKTLGLFTGGVTYFEAVLAAVASLTNPVFVHDWPATIFLVDAHLIDGDCLPFLQALQTFDIPSQQIILFTGDDTPSVAYDGLYGTMLKKPFMLEEAKSILAQGVQRLLYCPGEPGSLHI